MLSKTREALIRAETLADQRLLDLQKLTDRYELLQQEHFNALRRLLEGESTLAAEKDKQIDLLAQIRTLTADKAVLMERLDLVTKGVIPLAAEVATPAPSAGHMPEEIEDAEFLLKHDRISHTEYEKILEEYGFTNTEIELADTPDIPRLS